MWLMDGGIAIPVETTPTRIEMFHHIIKMTTQNNFVDMQWPFPLSRLVDQKYRSNMPPAA